MNAVSRAYDPPEKREHKKRAAQLPKMYKSAFSMLILAITCAALFGQTTNLAPGGPGNDAHWASGLINLLNPEIIVVGGGVASGWSLFESHMRQQVVERAFPLPARSVRIMRAECGDNAGLLGAAKLAFTS